MTDIAVIEVGGTHATASLIARDVWAVRDTPQRVQLDSHAGAEDLLDAIASVARGLEAPVWGVAMPDPFDYVRGIGRFHDVGKFDSLDGVDVGAGLTARLGADHISFCNDADAFTLGEWAAGAGRGGQRVVGLTLGTGVGSGWIVDGQIVDPGTPPGGRIHQISLDGQPLEQTMSRRAIRAAYARRTGDVLSDVREIAIRAAAGDEIAAAVLEHALTGLGRAIAAPIADFGADLVVVGGSLTGSWTLLEPWLLAGWRSATDARIPTVRLAELPEQAPLIGAAIAASRD